MAKRLLGNRPRPPVLLPYQKLNAMLPFSKRLLWVSWFLLSTIITIAQGGLIKGKVTDAATGAPLTGISIKVKNAPKSGTSTNAAGEFAINASASGKNVLVFTGVGYAPAELPASAGDDILVTLHLVSKDLGEVVVVGYGTQKRANVTGAVSTLSSDAFKDRPITDASQALAGQVTGVWVNQTSGQPGSDGADVLIRGQGTLNNSSPLVLIDGIIGGFSSVNPSDIESMTVLKDAASSSIYGSRAANGVILITTKSGKKGPLQVEVNSLIGREKATRLPDQVTNSVQEMELFNTALINDGGSAHFSQTTIDEYKNGKDPLIYPNNDWINMVIRPANMQKLVARMSGGKEETQYSVSLGYLNQDGIVMNDNTKQYTLNLNLRSKVSQRFDWGIRSNFMNQTQHQSYYNGNTSGMLVELMRALPYYGTYTANGSYASTWVNAVNAQFNNPYAILNNGFNNNNGNSVVGNTYFNLDIIKGLKWNVTGGINYQDNLNQVFVPLLYVYNPKTELAVSQVGNSSRSLTDNWGKTLLTTLFSTLTYRKTFFTDHDLTIMGGYSQDRWNNRTLMAYIEGLPNNNISELDAGSLNKNVGGNSYDYAIRSWFGRLNYAFRDKYLLEGNLRYDGSSRFAPAHRWGLFPSFSAGWRISEEAFMRNQHILSNLKLRGSWGKLGNDRITNNIDIPTLYGYIPTLSLGSNYYFNGAVSPGAAQTALSNPDITWETAKKTDIGLEAGFLHNRLNVEFDYFNELREGILQNIKIPTTVGNLGAPPENLASVRNKGWEFGTNYTQNITKDLKLGAGFNVTHVRNRVEKIPTPQIGINVVEEGQPINAFYMWKAIGLFKTQTEVDNSPKPAGRNPAPGDIKFHDISGPDGKPDGVIDAYDRQVVGKPIPTWTYGVNLSAQYKGFDLSVLLQGVKDVQSYVGSELFFPFVNGAGVATRWETGKTWTPENPNASLPRLLPFNTANSYNYSTNSFWLQDASYMRVKNIELGYNFSGKALFHNVIKSVRVYVDAQNAFTITKFQGLDPERSLTNTSGSYQYPNIRIFTGGINVKF